MNLNEMLFFGGFLLFVLLMLALDLGVFHRKEHEVTTREAALWSSLWFSLSMGMYFFILYNGEILHGIADMEKLIDIKGKYNQPFILENTFLASLENYKKILSLEYLTGYVIELSLSVDNIFVIILIFASFGVEKKMYHRVLFWGILGAIVMRFFFIFAGSYLITHFAWIIYLFAAFLIFTGIKMFLQRDKEETIDIEKHPIVRFCSKHFRVHKQFEGKKFFIKQNGKTYITPLFVVLLMVEFTDLIFAVDSVPAIFAITKDPYIVFYSNIFAILGLRSMFFLLFNVIGKFHYFKLGLAFILVFVGVKMMLHEQLQGLGFTTMHSLVVIVSILTLSIVASLLFPKKK